MRHRLAIFMQLHNLPALYDHAAAAAVFLFLGWALLFA
jgi:hypothetical protein